MRKFKAQSFPNKWTQNKHDGEFLMSTHSRLPLEAIEKASIDELRSLQLKRLKATLQHAYDNSPVYKLKFDSVGVHPSDCQTLADSTFAFACNSYNKAAVAAGCSIEFLKPGQLGDVLTCVGQEQSMSGRHGKFCDHSNAALSRSCETPRDQARTIPRSCPWCLWWPCQRQT